MTENRHYMKVLHITSSVNGGAGIAAVRLNNALNNYGIESHILCLTSRFVDSTITCVKTPIIDKLLRHSHLPIGQNKYLHQLGKLENLYEAVSFPEAFYDITIHPLVKEADVINLHWVGSMLNYHKFFSKIDKPIVWTLHDMNPFLGISHYWGDYYNNIEFRKLEEKARNYKTRCIVNNGRVHVVNLCEWMRNFSQQSEAFSRSKHSIIRNSVNIDIFKLRDKIACRKALCLPLDKPLLLAGAQSLQNLRKGFDLLLNAMQKVDIDLNLILFGNQHDVDVPDNLSLFRFGQVNDEYLLSLLYSAADFFVLPSREDNLPNTMLESLCCGTPVISFTNGGMTDIILDGDNGYLVTQSNGEDLASTIKMAINDQNKFDRQAISDKAREMFAPKIQAAKYIQLYKSLLA